MSEDDNPGPVKRDLASLLAGYAAKPPSPNEKQRQAQLTEYASGSGEGIDEIRAALIRDPDNERLLDWLAFSLYSNNELAEAIPVYEKLVERFPDNITYHYYLGNSFAKKGSVQRAIVCWKRVVHIDPYGKMGRKAAARVEQASKLIRLVQPGDPR